LIDYLVTTMITIKNFPKEYVLNTDNMRTVVLNNAL